MDPVIRPFWQPYRSTRSVVVVGVNDYTIEPGANLHSANLAEARADDDTTWEGVRPTGFDPVPKW